MDRFDLYNYKNNDTYIQAEINLYKKQKQRLEDIGNKDLSERYNKIIKKLIEQQKQQDKIVEKLEQMENPIYRNILFMKYISGLSLKEISYKMNNDYAVIRRYNGWALNEFDKICN